MQDLNDVNLIGRLTRDAEIAYVGQTAKSEALFEQAVEKSVVGQYEEYVIASDTYALVTK